MTHQHPWTEHIIITLNHRIIISQKLKTERMALPLTREDLMRVNSSKEHVLAIPFPVQGHVMPLMKLSQQIEKHGIKVTFLNTEYTHSKVVAAMSDEQANIELTSVPDGLSADDDRNNGFIVAESLRRTLPGNLTNLMERVGCDGKISCVIADITIGWILDVAIKMGAQPVGFLPSSAAQMAFILDIPKLIQAGNLDMNGTMVQSEVINLSDDIPCWRKNELMWSVPGDLTTQKLLFEFFMTSQQSAHHARWFLCNTFHELEPSASNLIPNLYSIGPLLSNSNGGSFWVNDSTCLSWLDDQPVGSVIYVSFGSTTVFSQDQFNELGLGLELSGRPFLWVVRSNLANGSKPEYPNGFMERVAQRGKIVEWAPQAKVLAHSSVGCFVSHCGWNSTMEGLSMGVPFLCWPYFVDQFHNQSYICDQWEIGLRVNPDENGLRSRHEIKAKIEVLFSDDSIKGNALKLRELALKSVGELGSSFQNFETFIDLMKK